MSAARWVGLAAAGATLVLALAGCGSSGPSSSTGTTQPAHATTTSTSAPASTTTTTSATSTTSGPMVTASLPVIVCNTTSGVATTTTSLPASASVSVPPSSASSLAVYTDATGRLMLIGPLTGWMCAGIFGADGSGTLALTPAGTTFPIDTGTTWHLAASSPTQAIVATESGGSAVQGAALVCPLFSAAQTTARQDLGKSCPADPAQEHVVKTSSVEVAFADPPGVAGIGLPSGGQNPANGVALYQSKPTGASAYLATCTLPAAQQDLCTAVLNHFVATFG